MKVTYDPLAKVAYIKLRPGVSVDTIEIAPSVYMDLDEEGRALGFEFHNPEKDFDALPPVVAVVVYQYAPGVLDEMKQQSAG